MKLKVAENFKALLGEGRRFNKNEDGQIIVFTALAGLALVMMVATIFNVGVVIGEKIKVQNTADAAAYSQAVWEARVLNLLAYTNRAIISHMVTIAFVTAFKSQKELWQRIELVLSGVGIFIPPVQVIARVAGYLHRFWSIVALAAPPVQRLASRWTRLCQLFQSGMMTEFALVMAQGRISNRIANYIDPSIKMNGLGNTFGGAANINSLRKLTGVSPRLMNFNSLKEVYINSMDGFSKGTSFPRQIQIGSKWVQFKFGLRGEVKVDRNRITQKDGFFLKMIYRTGLFGGWKYNWQFNAADAHYNGLPLGRFRMWSQPSASNDQSKNAFPSVYAVAQKDHEDILQISLLGAGTDQDIMAFSRAEVFYWDPDRARSRQLKGREPNLFNPFWHARLAAMDGAMDFLPEILLTSIPLTH